VPTPPFAGALVLGLALVLASCGGGSTEGSSSGANASPTTASTANSRSTTEADAESEGGIRLDPSACAELNEAAAQLDLAPVFLQLDSPEDVAAARAKLLGDLDLDVFYRAMVTLHQLDGFDGPLGDPSSAIDVYEEAAVKALPLFEVANPNQADINAYQASLGDPGAFLSYQSPIAAALSDAGC
jgi:hypothetical protein